MDALTFQKATGTGSTIAQKWYDVVSAAMALYNITTNAEIAMFLAQVGHESAGFVFTTELWGPTAAQAGYDKRADLGNTDPNAIRIAASHGSTPGPWWKGHGLIQTTGYTNHGKVGTELGIDTMNTPGLLAQPDYAALSAAFFWSDKALNQVADANTSDAFILVTRAINGGTNGLQDRQNRWQLAKGVLGV